MKIDIATKDGVQLFYGQDVEVLTTNRVIVRGRIRGIFTDGFELDALVLQTGGKRNVCIYGNQIGQIIQG